MLCVPTGGDAIAREDRIQHVYANVVAVHGGAFDVALDFGHRIEKEAPDYSVRVSMSWEHALALIRVLERVLEAHQGEIGTLPDVEKAIGAGERVRTERVRTEGTP
jgi:hypothetical protein